MIVYTDYIIKYQMALGVFSLLDFVIIFVVLWREGNNDNKIIIIIINKDTLSFRSYCPFC